MISSTAVEKSSAPISAPEEESVGWAGWREVGFNLINEDDWTAEMIAAGPQ